MRLFPSTFVLSFCVLSCSGAQKRESLPPENSISSPATEPNLTTEEDETAREEALRQHVEAVRNHIRALSEKDYSQLHGLHSPDFVFLFMPIEPAFVAAFQQVCMPVLQHQ